MPWLEQMRTQSFLSILLQLHTGELTFSDWLYFHALFSMFGMQLKYYIFVSLGIHFTNVLLLFLLLRRGMGLSFEVSFLASLMYLGFYGHFHAYTWPFAAHHLLVVFFILLITFFYLKANERLEQNPSDKRYYWITLGLSFVASFLRLSILIVPVSIFIHIFFSNTESKKVLDQFDRWIPVFIIFPFYQMIVLGYGGEGAVLSDFLSPWHKIMGDKGGVYGGARFVAGFWWRAVSGQMVFEACSCTKKEQYP